MAYHVTRSFVEERLGISKWAGYSLIKSSYLSYISSDDVVKLLNKSRCGREEMVDFIPSDIITPQQAEAEVGIPAKRLVAWTHRSVNVPPHYHFNNKTIRFRRSSLESWLGRRRNG